MNAIFFNLDLSRNGGDIPKDVICRKNKSLTRVLYKVPECMDFKERTETDNDNMLTVVVEISVCNHIKVIVLNKGFLVKVVFK